MHRSRLRTTLAIATLIAALAPRHALAQTGGGCTNAVDPCCAAKPTYTDPNYAPFSADVLVGTREVESGTNACLTIFNIANPYPGNGVNFAAVQRYHGPGDSWNSTNLGSVFGLTLDKFGNIFVCQTTCYGIDFIGPGGNGAIYRIANGTGAINTFCNLPNSGVGLGNISYDCEHDQFFVTNHEDGMIYRIKTSFLNAPTASIQESFDPMAPDNGTVGFAPLGERLWGVKWHAGRVYYSVWSQNCNETGGPPNSIRSVALDGSGAFVGGSDQLEIVLPPHVAGYSHPVSDISFGPKGSMFLAERSMNGPSSPVAHESRMMEYICLAPGGWTLNVNPYVLGVAATCCCTGIAGNGTNCAGGVAVDFKTFSPVLPFGRVWGTSDAIDPFLTVYGIQGIPPGGGTPAVSAWVDFDGSVAGTEKTNLGDVEIPCPDVVTATTMSMFTADPSGDALRVRWAFSDMSEIANVSLERADQSSGPWSAISADRRVEGGLTVAIDRQVEAGHTYYYRLVAETTGGETLTFGPVTGSMVEAISKFALSRPTPNPTQGSVTMEFSVPRASYVRVSIVDVQGREVAKLADGDYRPGRYTATWDAARAGGAGRGALYFARYQTPAGTYMRRIVVTP